MLARRTEVNPFDVLDREFNKMLGRYWGAGAEVPAQLAPYAVDVHEDADHFYVDADLPGFGKEDVEVTLEDGVLTIRAEKKEESRLPKGGEKSQRVPLHVERRWTRFERSFTLPAAVNENAVQAVLDEGVLKVTLDKREEVKPRKVQITAGAGAPRTIGGNGGEKKA